MDQNKKHGTYQNGTNFIRNINDEIMHQCQYCETWFIPGRRFVQKYCSESCRVSACKKRKVGMFGVTGGNVYDRSNVTNQTLVTHIQNLRHEMKEYRERIKELEASVAKESEDIQDRMAEYNNTQHERNLQIVDKIQSINDKVDWNLLVSTILPFLAPYIQKRLKEASEDKNKSSKDVLKEFQGYASEFSDDIPEDYKKNVDKITNIATDMM